MQRRKLGWKELSKLVRLKHNQEAKLGWTRDNMEKNMENTISYLMSSNKTLKNNNSPYSFTIFLHHPLNPPIATHNPCLKQLPVHIARWPCNHLLSNWKISDSWICHLRPTNLQNLGRAHKNAENHVDIMWWVFWRLEHELPFSFGQVGVQQKVFDYWGWLKSTIVLLRHWYIHAKY